MEKILDQHLRERNLSSSNLYEHQYAYQKGKSTVTALRKLVHKIERTYQAIEIAFTFFLDIEGAFDNTTLSVEQVLLRKDVDLPTVRWINEMLRRRNISAKLSN